MKASYGMRSERISNLVNLVIFLFYMEKRYIGSTVRLILKGL